MSGAEETHLTSRKLNRISRYIRKGSLKKLTDFLSDQYIDLRRVIFSKQRNALHIACKHHQKDIVKYLLRLGLDLLHQDAKGNVPLLVAALTNLRHRRSVSCGKITELLLSRCKGALTIQNLDGICAKEVLEFIKQKEEYEKKKKKKKMFPQVSSDSSECEDSDIFSDFDSEESDSEWLEKMQMEFEDVYFQEFGKFEDDFVEFDFNSETYDDWVDRMQKEYNVKRKASNETHYRKRPKRDETQNESSTNNIKQEIRQIDELTNLKLKRRKYEKQCKYLFEKDVNDVITLKYVPVPNEMFIKILLSLESDEAGKKVYLKKQQITWHPDKFIQKCGHRLLGNEREAILDRVNQISQLINSYLDGMTN